jgi:hypothetical protein
MHSSEKRRLIILKTKRTSCVLSCKKKIVYQLNFLNIQSYWWSRKQNNILLNLKNADRIYSDRHKKSKAENQLTEKRHSQGKLENKFTNVILREEVQHTGMKRKGLGFNKGLLKIWFNKDMTWHMISTGRQSVQLFS